MGGTVSQIRWTDSSDQCSPSITHLELARILPTHFTLRAPTVPGTTTRRG